MAIYTLNAGMEATLANNGVNMVIAIQRNLTLVRAVVDMAIMFTDPAQPAEQVLMGGWITGVGTAEFASVAQYPGGPLPPWPNDAFAAFGPSQFINPNGVPVGGASGVQGGLFISILKAEAPAKSCNKNCVVEIGMPVVAGQNLFLHLDHSGPGAGCDAEIQTVIYFEA